MTHMHILRRDRVGYVTEVSVASCLQLTLYYRPKCMPLVTLGYIVNIQDVFWQIKLGYIANIQAAFQHLLLG
jgi:hypothetical protein